MTFKIHFGLVVTNQTQKTKIKTLSIHFENAIHRVLHERSNITAPFAEHLEFPEKRLLNIHFGSNVSKQNK